jgi:citrate lyase subunit beta/citryl-CoA lyase
MGKAFAAGADALILDLEDAVAPGAKAEARRHVADFVRGVGGQHIWVRVNPLDSPENERDLDAILAERPHGIVLPKAEGGHHVDELARRLTERGNVSAQIMAIATETPAAIFGLGSYGGAKRLAGLTWGAEDLPAAIGAVTSREEDGSFTAPYEIARSLCLFGAAAAGVMPIETIYPAFKDWTG